MKDFTIGQLARAAGVGVETVRFYEQQGLVEQPLRPREGYRRYPPETVVVLRFIRRAKDLGFTLPETADLLSFRRHEAADCATVRWRPAFLPRLAASAPCCWSFSGSAAPVR